MTVPRVLLRFCAFACILLCGIYGELAHADTPPVTGTTDTPGLNPVWQRDLPEAIRFILPVQNRIFALTQQDGGQAWSLRAIDSVTAKEIWSVPHTSDIPQQAMMYDSGKVFVIQPDLTSTRQVIASLVAYDAATGNVLWTEEDTDGTLLSVGHGLVYESNHLGIVAHRGTDGSKAWSVSSTESFPPRSAVTDDGVIFAYGCKTVMKLDPTTGKTIWQYNGGNAQNCDFGSPSLILSKGKLYSRTFDDRTGNIILDAATGTPVGSFAAKNLVDMYDDTWFISENGNTGLQIQNRASTTPLWSATVDNSDSIEGQSYVNKRLYLITRKALLSSYNVTTGEKQWGYDLQANGYVSYSSLGTLPPLLVAGQGILVAAVNHTLTVFGSGPAPTLSAVSPAQSTDIGDPTITLTGTNFADSATVTFGGLAATHITVLSPTTITVTPPAHVSGTVDITVKNLDGQTATLSHAFTYTATVWKDASFIPPTQLNFTGNVGQTDLRPPFAPAWVLFAKMVLPAVGNGKLYFFWDGVAGKSGLHNPDLTYLYAMDTRNGHLLWRSPVPKGVSTGPRITYDDGRIFSFLDETLTVWDAETGQVLWNLSARRLHSIDAYHGLIYVTEENSDGQTYDTFAYRENDGSLAIAFGNILKPVVKPDGLYSITATTITKRDLVSGAVRWQYTSPMENEDNPGDFSVYGGKVYIRYVYKGSIVLDSATGKVIGTFPGKLNDPQPAFDGNIGVFVNDGQIETHDLATGQTLWSATIPKDPFLSPPVIMNNIIYSMTNNGNLYALDLLTGKQQWTEPTGYNFGKHLGLFPVFIVSKDALILYNFKNETWVGYTPGNHPLTNGTPITLSEGDLPQLSGTPALVPTSSPPGGIHPILRNESAPIQTAPPPAATSNPPDHRLLIGLLSGAIIILMGVLIWLLVSGRRENDDEEAS